MDALRDPSGVEGFVNSSSAPSSSPTGRDRDGAGSCPGVVTVDPGVAMAAPGAVTIDPMTVPHDNATTALSMLPRSQVNAMNYEAIVAATLAYGVADKVAAASHLFGWLTYSSSQHPTSFFQLPINMSTERRYQCTKCGDEFLLGAEEITRLSSLQHLPTETRFGFPSDFLQLCGRRAGPHSFLRHASWHSNALAEEGKGIYGVIVGDGLEEQAGLYIGVGFSKKGMKDRVRMHFLTSHQSRHPDKLLYRKMAKHAKNAVKTVVVARCREGASNDEAGALEALCIAAFGTFRSAQWSRAVDGTPGFPRWVASYPYGLNGSLGFDLMSSELASKAGKIGGKIAGAANQAKFRAADPDGADRMTALRRDRPELMTGGKVTAELRRTAAIVSALEGTPVKVNKAGRNGSGRTFCVMGQQFNLTPDFFTGPRATTKASTAVMQQIWAEWPDEARRGSTVVHVECVADGAHPWHLVHASAPEAQKRIALAVVYTPTGGTASYKAYVQWAAPRASKNATVADRHRENGDLIARILEVWEAPTAATTTGAAGSSSPGALPAAAAVASASSPGASSVSDLSSRKRNIATADPNVAAFLNGLPKSKTFGKLMELRLKSDEWWSRHFAIVKNKNYSGLQRLGNIDEMLEAPAPPPPSAPESFDTDQPWRWLGFSADETRERIEAEIDDEILAELADVPPSAGTTVKVPSSQDFVKMSRIERLELINRLRDSDTLGSIDLYEPHGTQVVSAAAKTVVAPPVPATDKLPFRPPIVKSPADWTRIRTMFGWMLWEDLKFAVQYKGRSIEDIDELTVMEHHAPVAYHFAAPSWDMAFAPKLQAGHIRDMAKGLVFDDLGRAALPGSLHRLSTFFERGTKVPNQLIIRVGRTITGPAWVFADIIAQKKSVLITAPPAHGKTTLVRDFARLVAHHYAGRKVCVIDRSEELGGASIQWSSALGEKVHVIRLGDLSPGEAINRTFRNVSPAVVMSDEIGTMAEAEGMVSAKMAGVEVISTAHGTLADVVDNAIMKKLAGNVVSMTVGDEWAQGTVLGKKTRREREREPVFDVLIQIIGLTEWRIFWNFAQAIDGFLEGKNVPAEVRKLDGDVLVFRHEIASFEARPSTTDMPPPTGEGQPTAEGQQEQEAQPTEKAQQEQELEEID
ncbi:hypothetical protein HDU86_001348 [Geranomyces michiganensis]|nr:hypothetical protein HDU86_001348 [Geranomyces michiganensis]